MAAKNQTRKGRQSNGSPINPLPSLIRASAWDAGNFSMRDAGRSKWSRKDFNTAAATQERLIRACYSRPTDTDPRLCYIRFGIAEQWQQARYTLACKWDRVIDAIDQWLARSVEQAA